MAFTVGAFAEDIDSAGVNVNIAAIVDQHLFTQGDDMRVPSLNRLLAVSGGIGSGGDGLLRLGSPSLRDINRLVVNPLNGLADTDVEPSDPIAILMLNKGPRQLATDEILQVVIDSDTSAAAFQWAIVFFTDGSINPVTGDIVTVHTTGGTTVTARQWSIVSLTFADTLPRGRYQVVGMRAFGATCVAARLVFKPGTWRPGCIGVDSQATIDVPEFRYGGLGVWGEFEDTTPPDAEFLCDVADTAQQVELDLIKVA